MLNIIAISATQLNNPLDTVPVCEDSHEKITNNHRLQAESRGRIDISNSSKSNHNLEDSFFLIAYSNINTAMESLNTPITWKSFVPEDMLVNKPGQDVLEYVYNPFEDLILDRPTDDYGNMVYDSPVITMMVGGQEKMKIFIYNKETSGFTPECINNWNYIPFFTLSRNEKGFLVSSVLVLFEYQQSIYCSVVEVKPSPMSWVKKYMDNKILNFNRLMASQSSSTIKNQTVAHITMILQNIEVLDRLNSYQRGLNTTIYSITRTRGKDLKFSIPVIAVNKVNTYNKNHWSSYSPINMNGYGVFLYSKIDNMKLSTVLPVYEIRNKESLIWKLRDIKDCKYLKILNEIPRNIKEGVYNYKEIHIESKKSNQTDHKKVGSFVFFRSRICETNLYCTKYRLNADMKEIHETVEVSDINAILFILKTTNIIYSLTGKRGNHTAIYTSHPIFEEQKGEIDAELEFNSVSNEFNTQNDDIMSSNSKSGVDIEDSVDDISKLSEKTHKFFTKRPGFFKRISRFFADRRTSD